MLWEAAEQHLSGSRLPASRPAALSSVDAQTPVRLLPRLAGSGADEPLADRTTLFSALLGGWCETTARLACPRIPAGCVVVGRRTNPVRLPPPPCHPGADDPLADRAPFHTTLLDRPYGVCLGALLTLGYLELHALALFQGLVTVHLDRAVVDENVRATVDRDEAVSLLRVEPLDGALSHSFTPVAGGCGAI